MDTRSIVMITWDSVRADHCSCYDYEKDTTPFLNKLARKGLKFENAIVAGLATPVSMSSIFTGKHNSKGKIKSKTLAEVLKKQGYTTLAFHSNPYASRFFGFDRGFDIFKDYVWKDEEGYRSGYSHPIREYIKKIIRKLKIINIDRVRFWYNILMVIMKNEYAVGLNFQYFYDDVIRSITNLDKPFFLWILLIETHFPYAPSNWNRWEKAKSMLIYDKYYKFGGVQKRVKIDLNRKELRFVLDAYDECIREADWWTKKLWNDLKEYNPIFIVHADHGDAFGEHGFLGHPPEHYEYLIRVPLVIYNADVKGVIEEPISLVRLAPTICELAGIKDHGFKYPSLFEDSEYRPSIVENKLKEGYRLTVRDKEWKLIINPDRKNELYNIKKDPLEQDNLINDEFDIVKELKEYINQHILENAHRFLKSVREKST